tara:strand:- start:78 stop:626 length:549 start_codon:yes stop_codon:yes gene_type:complete
LIAFTVLPLLCVPNDDVVVVVILAECETDVDAFLRALLHTLSSWFPPAERAAFSLSFLSAPEKNFDSLFAPARIINALLVALRLVNDLIIIIALIIFLRVVVVVVLLFWFWWFWWWCEVDAALLKAIQSVSPKTNWMRTTTGQHHTTRRRQKKTTRRKTQKRSFSLSLFFFFFFFFRERTFR